MTYEVVQLQVQYHAVTGHIDGDGMGKMTAEIGRKIFSSKDEAGKWLDKMGWPYDDKLMRRRNEKLDYTMAEIRTINERDKTKWLDENNQPFFDERQLQHQKLGKPV